MEIRLCATLKWAWLHVRRVFARTNIAVGGMQGMGIFIALSAAMCQEIRLDLLGVPHILSCLDLFVGRLFREGRFNVRHF